MLACEAAAGLSLGEYTAMVFAGVMEFEDALAVVQKRGEAMQEAADATPSGMVSILGLEQGQVERLCEEVRQPGEILQVANLLCPGNVVISGDNAACERVAEAAPGAGAMKAVPLAVAGAFHTPIMQPAVERLAAALAGVALSPPKIPVVSNVDARPHDDPEEIRQLADPAARFARALGGLHAAAARRRMRRVLRSRPGNGCCGACSGGSTERSSCQTECVRLK